MVRNTQWKDCSFKVYINKFKRIMGHYRVPGDNALMKELSSGLRLMNDPSLEILSPSHQSPTIPNHLGLSHFNGHWGKLRQASTAQRKLNHTLQIPRTSHILEFLTPHSAFNQWLWLRRIFVHLCYLAIAPIRVIPRR